MQSEISSKKKENNILILGGGYVGTQLFDHLYDKYPSVWLVTAELLNYHDTNRLSKFLLNKSITTVINCSGFTGKPNVDEAESKKEQCWFLNVMSPLDINKTCNNLGIEYIHISSGCIYSGYLKDYTEDDKPDFGLFNESSFYSKSKHAFELMSKGLKNRIVRLRMPICNDLTNPRNYLKKIMEYPNLIDYENSKTYIPDLCGFIKALIDQNPYHNGQDIYNVVNGAAKTTKEVIAQLNSMNEGNWKIVNPNWVHLIDLDIKAPRSNCVLDNTKASKIFPLSTEEVVLNMVCNYNNGIQAT